LFAIEPLHHDDNADHHHGSAWYSGAGKVYHDGDYIEFSIDFTSKCFADRDQPWSEVNNNVATFVEWANIERTDLNTNIEYSIGPIKSGQEDSYGDDECDGSYYVTQNIKLTLKKTEGSEAIDHTSLEDFYARLQAVVWPLQAVHAGERVATTFTNISTITKGVYESTVNALRRQAQSLARDRAIEDFRYFLGENYTGNWYLQSADYREYIFDRFPISGGGMASPSYKEGSLPVPATLKLDPLSIDVIGNFHFVFDIPQEATPSDQP
jgi:hypothetical protein